MPKQLKKAPIRWIPDGENTKRTYFDLGIRNTHAYFANGVLVSNSHFKLAEPFPNPLFERAVKALCGLDTAKFDGIMSGRMAVDPDTGKVVPEDDSPGLKRGGHGIAALLARIDRDKELDLTLQEIPGARGQKLDEMVKKAKILRALKAANLQPTVYTQQLLPVLPPQLRPITVTGSGDVSYEDINGILKAIALDNQQLLDFPSGLPESEKAHLREELYDGLQSLVGLGGTLNREQDMKGVLDLIHGSELKHGFFQKMLLKRRLDMTARGVVVPNNDIGLDELGIPKKVAKTLYEPFVIRELHQIPYSMSVADAKKALEDETSYAMNVLDKMLAERPLAMKRDPALHKHSVQGFYPKIVAGSSIHVNPMIVAGYNMDFDGDAVSLYVPMTQDAVEDVKKMVPTQILKSTTSHDIQYFPRLDALLGLYKLSDVGNRTAQRYSKASDLLSAFKAGKVDLEDIVKLEGKDTTAGRALVAEGMPEDDMRNKVLYDLDYRLDNKGINKLLHFYTPKPDQFKRVAEHINALGFTNASGTTVSLADLKTLTKMRDDILKRADIKASHISARDPNRNDKLVEIYMAANEELKKGMDGSFGKHNPNMLYTAYKAGAKVKWDNVRQILATPMIVTSAGGVPIPIPIRHSYAEGLDSAEYWIASHGSRKSMYDRTMEASLPGAINKQLTNVAMNMVITEKDCGSRDGVLRPVDAVDIVDRYLAAPVKLKNGVTLTTNTPLTSGVIAELKKSKVSSVMVRSPLRCRAHQGLCQHDYGLGPDGKPPMVGENVGVAASAAFGERGVQLALRAFHDAGVHKGKNLMNAISRVRQIVNMPEILPDSAILATEAGTVTKVERDPAGGHRVFIGADDHYIPYGRELIVKPGDKVQKGRPMTRGPINPHELLELGGIKAVQHYMTDALDEIYSKENVRRVHSEVIVKTLTNIGKVVDPGDNDNYLHSDLASVQAMDSWNKENPNKKPIKYEAVLKGAEILPLEQTEDWLARLAYRRPGETLSRGTVEGWVSQLHGTHPVPGAVTGAEFGKPPKGEKGPY